MADRVARLIAETYRWRLRLGARVFATSHCCVVADPAHPDVWDANHADDDRPKHLYARLGFRPVTPPEPGPVNRQTERAEESACIGRANAASVGA
jgi:hypothetical protein